MFPIPAEKETDSWMVAHTKTTAIKKPRRFICKIVRFSSLTFDWKETTLVSRVWMRFEMKGIVWDMFALGRSGGRKLALLFMPAPLIKTVLYSGYSEDFT